MQVRAGAAANNFDSEFLYMHQCLPHSTTILVLSWGIIQGISLMIGKGQGSGMSHFNRCW